MTGYAIPTERQRKRVELTCPYCGSKFYAIIGVDINNSPMMNEQIVTCNDEDYPGCGESFVVTPLVTINVLTYAMILISRDNLDKLYEHFKKEQERKS